HDGMAEREGGADDVVLGRLELEHGGAGIGEELGRVRTHHHGGEIEQAHAVKRTAHAFSSLSSSRVFAGSVARSTRCACVWTSARLVRRMRSLIGRSCDGCMEKLRIL